MTPKIVRLMPLQLSLLALISMLAWLNAHAQTPAPQNQAGLVIRHGDGRVVTRCVSFTGTQISGLDLLRQSDVAVNITNDPNFGELVCRLDNEGCSPPEEACFCECPLGAERCFYWTYWHRGEDAWQFSGVGAAMSQVPPGGVNGWQWGGGDSVLPELGFAEICGYAPPVTPTPTATPEPELIYLPLIIKL